VNYIILARLQAVKLGKTHTSCLNCLAFGFELVIGQFKFSNITVFVRLFRACFAALLTQTHRRDLYLLVRTRQVGEGVMFFFLLYFSSPRWWYEM
jgi:hypothetical protein